MGRSQGAKWSRAREVISLEIGLCVEMAFRKDHFEARIEKAARIGFKYVEMWLVDDAYKGSPIKLAEVAREHGVKITNTVIGNSDGKVGGGLTNPSKRKEWLQRARMTIDFNMEAGIPATIVCTGNEVPGMTDPDIMKSVLEGLEPTIEIAEEADITLLLEPLNTRHDHPGYWLTSSDRGAEICRRLGSKRMRMLFDCYHMQIMEGDLVSHIERNMDVIGHFHCAGVPGRHEPYEGEVNYAFLIKRIGELGYDGIFGLEYSPTIGDEESLNRTLEYLTTNS